MAARVVQYWKTRRSDLINNRQPSWQLLQLGTDLNIPFVSLSVNKIMKNITAARKQLRQIQHNAAEICDAMLEEMARDHITSDTANIATIVKNIRHREE
eukprot:12875012-Ditylum_brightwellii.AAC.1